MTNPTRWIERNAHPLATLDPHAPLTDLAPLAGIASGAQVVALGASIRSTHELSAVAHRLLRTLVEELGFRSLALEGDAASRVGLDKYISGGQGDPRALLAGARAFWRTEEILDVIRWMRAYNQEHPDDPVRFAEAPEQPLARTPRLEGLAGIEQTLADNTVWWHERTGDKIVYWGGIAHTAVGNPRTVSPSSPPETHRNGGGYLRERLGAGYLSLGLTFDHGSAPQPIPAPAEDFVDAALGSSGLDAYLLDLRADVPEQFTTPTRTRMVGPDYDPGDDSAYHLSGNSLAGWFDAIVHVRKVTPAGFLT